MLANCGLTPLALAQFDKRSDALLSQRISTCLTCPWAQGMMKWISGKDRLSIHLPPCGIRFSFTFLETARKLCSASGCFNFIHTTPEISHCKKRPLTSHDWGQITYSLRNYHTGKTHGPSEGLYKHPILLQQQQNGYHSFVFVVYNTYIHIYNIILLSLGHMKSTSMVHCTLKAWLNTAASVQHCSFTLHCVWRGGSRWSYSY